MPKGYPINPEKTSLLRSIAQKNRTWSEEHKRNVRNMLIKRNKSKSHILKVKKALMGHGFSKETLEKISKNQPDKRGDKNPNWRGDKVGKIGVHIWLRKFFVKTKVCSHCGIKKEGLCGTDWALIKGKNYERKRENFMELCRKCHAIYDKTKEYCKNGHKMIPENLYNTKTGKRLCKLCNKSYRNKNENDPENYFIWEKL